MSVNFLLQYLEDGTVRVQTTPLMLGSFPAQAPPVWEMQGDGETSGVATEPLCTSWGEWAYMTKWTEGQLLLAQSVRHFRSFFDALPAATYAGAKMDGSQFLGEDPLPGEAAPQPTSGLFLSHRSHPGCQPRPASRTSSNLSLGSAAI